MHFVETSQLIKSKELSLCNGQGGDSSIYYFQKLWQLSWWEERLDPSPDVLVVSAWPESSNGVQERGITHANSGGLWYYFCDAGRPSWCSLVLNLYSYCHLTLCIPSNMKEHEICSNDHGTENKEIPPLSLPCWLLTCEIFGPDLEYPLSDHFRTLQHKGCTCSKNTGDSRDNYYKLHVIYGYFWKLWLQCSKLTSWLDHEQKLSS
jgi:hypothetical protein